MQMPFANFTQNPKNLKIAFYVTLMLSVIFLAGLCVLGYFYYLKTVEFDNLKLNYDELNTNYITLRASYDDLKSKEGETKEDLEKKLKDAEEENESLKAENSNLKKDMEEAAAYLAFFNHMTEVIDHHDGFTGWTEAEHQAGVVLARKTGDNDFVELVEWAWHNHDVNPVTRVVRVWDAIYDGINEALK